MNTIHDREAMIRHVRSLMTQAANLASGTIGPALAKFGDDPALLSAKKNLDRVVEDLMDLVNNPPEDDDLP